MNKPYGLFPSPITPSALAGALRLRDVQWDSDGETLVWLEGRSDQGALVAATVGGGDAPRDIAEAHSVRARVGYGGGDFGVGAGCAVFSAGGQLFRQPLAGGGAAPITPAFADAASPAVSPDGRWALYVFSHAGRDGLAVADMSGSQWPQQVATGHDFYMQPRWSPDGARVAFVAWDHPQMPWDGCALYLADVEANDPGLPRLANVRELAGGPEVAVFQPEFSPDGRSLAFLSDEGGWHNFYLHSLEDGTTRRLTSERSAQLGEPAWNQGMRMYGWAHDGESLLYVRNEGGFMKLWRHELRAASGSAVPGLEEYTALSQIAPSPTRPQVALLGSSGTQPSRIVLLNLGGGGRVRVLKRATGESVPPAALVAPEPISWNEPDGAEVFGLLYRPEASDSGGLPPAIVYVHGGPTSQTVASYDGGAQFFATRGYAVLQVNYRGSTGYGRDYMNALRGNWGVHDVIDVASGARHLAQAGIADGERLVIMGGSAGGFTVLQALIDQPGVFRAGICSYGVSNQFTLAADTHKFEERYLDSLLGPLPEAAATYRARSPIFHAEKLTTPIAVFQGEDDTVVPRSQSDAIVASLRERGVPHVYHVFAGEGHGWRKRETIAAFYRAIEDFLKQYVLFA
jgi:dipeptidyl aminopeptidase/acylaminoacyl peptidase